MRFATLVAVMILAGCAEPAPPGLPPDLRVLNDGVAYPPGEQVDLGLLSRDCATRLTVRLQNVGTRVADLGISGGPELLDVTPSSARLSPGDDTLVDFRVWPPNDAATDFAAALVITEGAHELRFPLRGTIVTDDWYWPERLDFGGIQVGTTASVEGSALTGLTAPFFSNPETRRVQFSPTAPGPFAQRATIVRRADCTFRPTMAVVGEGVAAQLTGPALVAFPDTAIGSASEQDVVIENLAALGGTTELRPKGATDFTLVGNGALVSAVREGDGGLTAGTSTLRVRFSPAAANARSGELWLTSGGAQLLVPLSGLGVP